MIDKIIIAAMITTTIALLATFVLVVVGLILNGYALVGIIIALACGPMIALMVAIMIELMEVE